MTNRRTPPQDIDAEDSVIGASLLSVDALDQVRRIVQPDDFVGATHRATFEAMCILRDAGESVDAVTVAPAIEHVESDALEWLRERFVNVPAVSAASTYASRVLACAKSRSLIWFAADLADAGFRGDDASDVARRTAESLLDDERLRRRESGDLRGFHERITALLAERDDRDTVQPWIARGLLRKGQRLMVVARAGIGKSTLLRQIAYCASAGVHPLTAQPQPRACRSLVVELEAGEQDIASSVQPIMLTLQRVLQLRSPLDVEPPALLHRPGGIDLRTPSGLAAVEAAIVRHQAEFVAIGPVKYMTSIKAGENYETAALGLHGVLNGLIERYGVAIGLEAHFSRGEHGAPGGSERWVDWPDVGFGIHPDKDDLSQRFTPGGAGQRLTAKQFRIPRDPDAWLPAEMIRGRAGCLPWSVDDEDDPYRKGSIFTTRYGGTSAAHYRPHDQQQF